MQNKTGGEKKRDLVKEEEITAVKLQKRNELRDVDEVVSEML